MIKIQAIGHLGKDATMNNVNGKTVINFTVAHSHSHTDQQGEKKTFTTWVNCSWWIERTKVLEYLKKGTQVYVEGIPSLDTYRNNEGITLPQLRLRVDSLQLLSSGANKENTNTPTASQVPGITAPDFNDEVPF